MRINFKHGIVKHQLPKFLTVNPTSVNLFVEDTPLILTISTTTKDLLFVENTTITNAWAPIVAGIDQWLYIDYNSRTAARTFGITTVDPVVGPTPPLTPVADQHWFDTTVDQMKVWVGNSWQLKIRIIVALLKDGVTPISISQNSPLFTGTQIGDNNPITAGTIIFSDGHPIKDTSGHFITTEDHMRTSTADTAVLKLASIVTEAVAQLPLTAYTIVKFTDFNEISYATAFTAAQDEIFGMIQYDVTTGNITGVIIDGVVENLDWDWSSLGINAPLYCDDFGQLVTSPVIPLQTPCATVIDKHTILLGTAKQIHNYPEGPILTPDLPVMTDIDTGVARLSVAADNPLDPIVLGINDPVFLDKLSKSGDTMTGALTLSQHPTEDFHAATKFYVDQLPTALSSLSDVILTNVSSGQVLQYNGTDWVNTNLNISSTLPDIIIPGTATKVTYNSKGLVTNATTLSINDLPSVPWNKLTSVPSTVAGYNITDVYTRAVSDAKYLQHNETITLTGAVTGSGSTTITTTLSTVPISKGGTGQTNANSAINALLPVQAGNFDNVLATDGTNTYWRAPDAFVAATTDTIGGIIVGDGLNVTFTGVLSTTNRVSSGDFASVNDCRTGQYVLYGITTTSTPQEILIGNLDQMILPEYSSWGFEILINACRTDGAAVQNGTWKFDGNVHRELEVHTVAITPVATKIIVCANSLAWDTNVDVDTVTGALKIVVTGVDGATIRWAAHVKTIEILYQ